MEYLLLYSIYQFLNLACHILIYNKIIMLDFSVTKRKFLISMFIWLLVDGATCFWGYSHEEPIFTILNLIMLLVLFSKERKKVVFGYITVYCMISFLGETITMLIGGVMHLNPIDITYKKGTLYNIVVIVLCVLIILLISRRINDKSMMKELIESIGVKECIIINIAVFSLVVLMSFVSVFGFMDEEVYNPSDYIYPIIILSLISVVAVVVLIIYMVKLIEGVKKQKQIILTYQQKSELQERYYQMIRKMNEEIRGFRHDYHFHIQYLNQQINDNNYEEAKTHINSLVDMDRNLVQRSRVFSGNSIIDAVIYGTVMQEDQEIDFHYIGKVKEHLGIQDIDLITLLSNALENAVEACGLCEGKKEIWMRLEQYKENLRFVIENTYNQQIVSKKELRYTTKKERDEHGYGRMNMTRIVEKYDGILEEGEKDGKYQVVIQLNQKLC